MALEFHWTLPTEGDLQGRYPGDPTARPDHWVTVARAAERAGFHALMVPSGRHRPDAWLDFAERVRRVQALAAGRGRTLRFACRVHVVTRDTEAAAWAAVEHHVGGPVRDRPADGIWTGHGAWRTPGTPRAGTALVGSHRQVAAQLAEFHRLGADSLLLSGDRGLEEACRIGEEVLPLVKVRVPAAEEAL